MPSAAPDISTDQLIALHKAQTISTDDLIKAHQLELKTARVPNTKLESAAQGALQSASLGFSDEIEGGLRAAKDLYDDPSKRNLKSLVDSYKAERDSVRARDEHARQDNPGSYAGGELAGTIGTAFIPGLSFMNVAKDASVAAKLASAAKIGAVMGAGTSNADLTKGEVEPFGEDVAQGALTGAATQGVLSAAGGAVQGAIDRFSQIPEQRAVKAVTGQNISALRNITDTTLKSAGDLNIANDNIAKVGRDILDEPGVLTPLSKVEDIAPKLGEARLKYGQLIGDVAKQIDTLEPKSVDAKNISQNILDYAAKIPENEAGKKLQNRLVEEAQNFEKIGNKGGLSFKDAQAFKNQFKYKAVDADALISNQDATNAVKAIIGSEMDTTAARLAKDGSPEVQDLLGQYGKYKSKYGSFKAASDAATDRVQKNLTNRFVSPSDYGVAATLGIGQALSQGGPDLKTLAVSLGAAGVNKFARERGSALAAKSADAIMQAFKSDGVQGLLQTAQPLINAAKQGNPAAVATFQILSQSNPKALEIINNNQAMQRRNGVK